MRVLIADDEPIARQVLREMLEDCAGIQIAGEAATGIEALGQAMRLKPELVFLDLQMPGLDGFSVARQLRGGGLPLVVYVTAFESHALEAFETGAVDYLLKPVRRERLDAAIEKARAQIGGLREEPAAPRPSELRKIVGRLGEDLHLLEPDDVIAFEAEGDQVLIVAASGRYYSDYSLKALDEKLAAPRFRRIHRRTIINTDHIRKISPLSSKRWLVKMSNGMEAIVSKRMAGAIRDATHW